MKTQTKQNKIIAIMSAVILLLVALSATLTFAYFTANATKENSQMTFGTLTISNANGDGLTFFGETDTCTAELGNITPGCTVDVSGKAIVESNIWAFVRVGFDIKANVPGENQTSIDLLADQTNGASLRTQLMATIFGASNSTTNELGKIFDGSTWVYYDADTTDSLAGYYYYKQAVKDITGSNAAPALKIFDFNDATITFDSRLYGDVWQGANIVITLSIQAIQAEHLKKANSDNEINLIPNGENKTIADTVIVSSKDNNVETGNVKDLAEAEAWTVANSSDKGVVTTNP